MAGRKKQTAPKPESKTEQYEEALAAAGRGERYVLRLYVSGATPRSLRAIQNIKNVCETRLKGRYDLEVIDVYQQPTLVVKDQVVAVPSLIKELPLPVRKLIGDLSDEKDVLVGLNLIKR